MRSIVYILNVCAINIDKSNYSPSNNGSLNSRKNDSEERLRYLIELLML